MPVVLAAALAFAPAGTGRAGTGEPGSQPPASRASGSVAPAPAFEVEALPGSRTPSGQPVPRFVSLRFKEVNLRVGPGTRYPASWVYRRANLPVEVVAEYDLWRMIRDPDGVTGWVHRSMLSGNRYALLPEGERILRRKPEEGARGLLRLGSGVIVRIRKCPAGEAYCRVQVGEAEGWILRAGLWGLYPDEVVD